MKCIEEKMWFQVESSGTAVTLGKFDGLHRGHQILLDKIEDQKKNGLDSMVFTFDMPPSTLITGRTRQQLNTNEERARRLERQGLDYLIVYPFNDQVCHMEPEGFVEQILCGCCHASYLAVGTDFRFGYRRSGDAELLLRLASKYGYECEVVEKAMDGNRAISSTYIREELAAGHMEKVNALLGYPFTVSGRVIHGAQLGRQWGMPTLNLQPDPYKQLPPGGVYCSCTIVDGVVRPGITNIGYKPTVSDAGIRGVESYLFDFDGDLYGKDVEVMLLSHVRPEHRFESVDLLKKQIASDIAFGKEYFKKYPVKSLQKCYEII
ncbi:bifunctional riboflavin kinase/FAD synthetase [Cuneatibacter caecimuris]|uniref:Riboflavin biosynthesis protein n=1 Tax=Cuneatibacter caecimuris TaxID=1796618 RepID=A0A4Q7P0L9_9FIRM|nr:bifunctional riboflavin kinase/FAD synthetase [Cuneatibacter caecimuris]RZS92828.1 riboflavin kinase/FMN adenylyltransferase [Cuneatibacter caecimuris]